MNNQTDKEPMIAAARALVSRRMDDWIDMTVNAIADDIAAFAIEQGDDGRNGADNRIVESSPSNSD
jgi:hypothetical protein